MGIHPTLLPVSPMALVRLALFQSHLHPLSLFVSYPFSFLFPFSFPVFPSFNSFSYFCVLDHHPLYHSISLPYDLPQEFSMRHPQSPGVSPCLCVQYTSISLLCCAVSSCLPAFLLSPRLTMFIPFIHRPSIHPSIYIHISICLSITHPNTHPASIYLSIYPSIPSAHQSVHPSNHLSVLIYPSFIIHLAIQHSPDLCFILTVS